MAKKDQGLCSVEVLSQRFSEDTIIICNPDWHVFSAMSLATTQVGLLPLQVDFLLVFSLCRLFQATPSVQQTPVHSVGLHGETVTVQYAHSHRPSTESEISLLGCGSQWTEMFMIVHAFYWDSRCFLCFFRLSGTFFCVPFADDWFTDNSAILLVMEQCLHDLCNDGFFQELFTSFFFGGAEPEEAWQECDEMRWHTTNQDDGRYQMSKVKSPFEACFWVPFGSVAEVLIHCSSLTPLCSSWLCTRHW